LDLEASAAREARLEADLEASAAREERLEADLEATAAREARREAGLVLHDERDKGHARERRAQ
jgi:hypothetical protein